MCINVKTKVVTHPGTTRCPRGSTPLLLGAKGQDGVNGLTGATGLNGRDGLDGKTLWNGIKDPENNWGAPGDMFINSVTKTLFGPKNLDGTWPTGVSMVGPKGEQGPIGLTGPAGPQGPAGATGATGPAGATGISAPRLFLWDSTGVKHDDVEFVGSWLENYYFKISGRIWRMNYLGSVKSFPVYYRNDTCTAPAVYVSGGSGWDENNSQPMIHAYFTNSYFMPDTNMYQITGPIITITTIYSFDGTNCTPMDGSFEVIKAERYSDVTEPPVYGRFTIGP